MLSIRYLSYDLSPNASLLKLKNIRENKKCYFCAVRCLRSFFTAFIHFISANSRHGTHSPFVYQLAEEVIYKRHNHRSTRQDKMWWSLLQEIAVFFGVHISLDRNEGNRSKALQTSVTALTTDDLAVLQHEFTFIALVDIYDDVQSHKRWKRIVADKRFVVTIDLYYFGLVFYRKGQLKQNFKLRFPYWKYQKASLRLR